MMRAIRIAAAVLAAAAAPVLAQGKGAPPKVLGATGTMYDGNNARLRLPRERDAWYANSQAGYVPRQAKAAPAAATGPGAAGTSLGTVQTGGEH